MAKSERRLAAIMFTDIVGYSALTQENEALALELLNEHFTLLRPIIPEHNGNEIKTMGDSFLVEFASPLQAVKCAIEFQRSLRKRNLDEIPDRQIQIRVGIHVGDVEHVDGDVIGDGVNIASRIEPLAEPGGIALTRQVYDQVYNKIDWELKSLGTPPLKNITTVVEIFKVDLKWESPSSAELVPTKAQRRDNYLKIGSVVAVAVIAVAAAFFLIQSALEPKLVDLEPGEITSLAVLPFVNLSSDQENEYFSDGMTEELLHSLARLGELRVPGRTSSFTFKGKDLSISEIGRQLNVEAILEGSVRKSEDQVKITAQLVRTSDDTHLWSGQFERDLSDIFNLQEEIAEEIVAALKIELDLEEEASLVRATTDSTEAYNLYLQGLHFWNLFNKSGWEKSIEYFEQAIEIDPTFAKAYAGLSNSYTLLVNYDHMPAQEGREKAREYAQSALHLDNELAEAHFAQALVLWFDLSYIEAELEFKRTFELNPNHATAHSAYANFLQNRARIEDSLAENEKAIELDPLSTLTRTIAGNTLFLARDFENALIQYEKAVELDPSDLIANRNIANTKSQLGDWEGAEHQYAKTLALHPEDPFILRDYGWFLAQISHFDEASAHIHKAIDINPSDVASRDRMGDLRTRMGNVPGAEHEYVQGIEKDPGNYLSFFHYAQFLRDVGRWKEAIVQYEKALEINSNNFNVQLGLILTKLHLGDFQGINERFKNAIEGDPSNGNPHIWYAHFLFTQGLREEGLRELDVALEINPDANAFWPNFNVGQILYLSNEVEKAIEQFKKILEIDSRYFWAHWYLSRLYIANAQYDEAQTEFELAVENRKTILNVTLVDQALMALDAIINAHLGEVEIARAKLQELLELPTYPGIFPCRSCNIASVHIALDDHDSALEWLERAYEDREFPLAFVQGDPLFSELRETSRFQALLAKMGISSQ